MDRRAKSVESRDVEGVMSDIVPHIVSFDVVGQLQKIGADERRKRATEWFSSFDGDIRYEVRDLSIDADDDNAFCHSLNRVNGKLQDGQEIDMWWRATVCFQKIGGRWLITHEHSSVPFDSETGNARIDLKP
jgi:ketosteroid isomerase-like protein